MIESDVLNTTLARLKIYEASIQTVNLSDTQGALEKNFAASTKPKTSNHCELKKAIADLELAQSKIVPGSLVRQKVTGEIGRVVSIFNTDGFEDTYVAFWGRELPVPHKAPNPRPYILRYCLSSLELLTDTEYC